MSALPPKADIGERNWDVRFVPLGDIELLAWLEDCGNLIRESQHRLHLSGSGLAMPMVARVALGATMVTEQKRGG